MVQSTCMLPLQRAVLLSPPLLLLLQLWFAHVDSTHCLCAKPHLCELAGVKGVLLLLLLLQLQFAHMADDIAYMHNSSM
jgi:hypothetical protein